MAVTFTESSGVADSVYGKSQAPIRAFIEARDKEVEAKSVLPKIFKMDKSNHWAEKRTGMTAMTGFQPVAENGDAPSDTFKESYASILTNVTWKDEFGVSREMVEDSKLISFADKPQAFIDGYHRAREKFGAAILGGAVANGASASAVSVTVNSIAFSTKSADDKNFFAKDHPSMVSGAAQCNCFSDAFSVDAMAAMECAMQDFRGDNNDILDVVPDTIIIPNLYSLKQAVFAAVGADKDPATANNGFNFMFGRWNIIVWNQLNQYITAKTAPWIMLSSDYNNSYSGLIFQDRTSLDVRSYINDSNDANIWHGFSRFTAGFHDWRAAAVGGVAAGNALIPTSESQSG